MRNWTRLLFLSVKRPLGRSFGGVVDNSVFPVLGDEVFYTSFDDLMRDFDVVLIEESCRFGLKVKSKEVVR